MKNISSWEKWEFFLVLSMVPREKLRVSFQTPLLTNDENKMELIRSRILFRNQKIYFNKLKIRRPASGKKELDTVNNIPYITTFLNFIIVWFQYYFQTFLDKIRVFWSVRGANKSLFLLIEETFNVGLNKKVLNQINIS